MLRGIGLDEELYMWEPMTYDADTGAGWAVYVTYNLAIKRAAQLQHIDARHARPTLIVHSVGGQWLPTMQCHNFAYGEASEYRRACLSVGAWVAGLRL